QLHGTGDLDASGADAAILLLLDDRLVIDDVPAFVGGERILTRRPHLRVDEDDVASVDEHMIDVACRLLQRIESHRVEDAQTLEPEELLEVTGRLALTLGTDGHSLSVEAGGLD